MARRHSKQSRKSRKVQRKSRRSQKQRRQSRKAQHRARSAQQGGAQCAAIPLQNSVFAQKGGMADYQVAGNDLLMDKAAMVQAQSFDQLGLIQEAGRIAAAAQHGGRRRRQSRKAHRKSRKQQKSRKQKGGMSPFDADTMLLPKSAYPFTGVNPQWLTEGSVQPALKMGAGPQAA